MTTQPVTKERPFYSYTCAVCGTEYETQAPEWRRPRKTEYEYCTTCCKTTAHKTHRIS